MGRFLSNWTPCIVETSIGDFRSIEGLIFYLGSFDESLRVLAGYEAKQSGEKLDRGIRLPQDVFKRFIVEGMESKLEHMNRELFNQFISSDLPLTHYYRYDTKVIEIPKWQWQVEEWERLKKRIKYDLPKSKSI
jgi:hypothetical protein